MIKLDNENIIYDLIRKALLATITNHGVIHKQLVHSATKRILGNIKTHIYNSKAKNVKRIRNGSNEYIEVIIMEVTMKKLIENISKLKELLCSEYAVHRSDGKSMDWNEAMMLGHLFEEIDKGLEILKKEKLE